MSKFSTSVDLSKRSAAVINENQKLLLFPLITVACIIVMAAFYLAPIMLASTGHALTDPAHWEAIEHHWFDVQSTAGSDSSESLKLAGYPLLIGFYLLSMFIATFFNVAFFHEILRALGGYPVSIRSGVRFAGARLRSIAVWSLFSGAVGSLVGALEKHVGVFGRWVTAVIGITWSVASIFVIPVIVRNDNDKGLNPLRYLKSSASLLRRTWGESLLGYTGTPSSHDVLDDISFPWGVTLGMGCLFLLLEITVIIVPGSIEEKVVPAIVFIPLGCIVFLWVCALRVIDQVYRGALFIYATEGVIPGPFNESDMNVAWKVKAARKALPLGLNQ